MSPLEIVLTVVLSVVVVVVVLYLFILNANKRNRYSFFEVLNREALFGSTIFLGDSLTDFYPIQDFFPKRLIYNRGIAGDQTSEVLRRLKNISDIRPKRIFLQIGTNDLGKNKRPIKVFHNIKTIIETLKNDIPKVEIYVISLYPISHHKMWISPIIAGLRTNKKIIEVNNKLQEYCNNVGLIYIDLHTKLKDQKGRLAKEYTLEGLHISAEGYALITNELRSLID